ncbi:hypothetical protein DRO66_11945 [Candidatus Bathyarchaeota archaeon]|nr:MAG: hypothetical protein DRO66_11945 [Candidatus Bathyarchaeota archaeon]
MYPLLLITPRISAYEKAFSEDGALVVKVRSPEDLHQVVIDYRYINTGGKTLVISDVYLARSCLSRLLKFVEEVTNNLVVITSIDGIDPVLMSRFCTVRKEPNLVKNETGANLGAGEEEPSYYQMLKETIKYRPQLLPLEYHLSRSGLPAKDKIKRILLKEPL